MSSNNATTPNHHNITIVVQLSGELGNHLSKLAAGVGVALELQRQYNITAVNLKLRHQPRTTKWIPAVGDLHRCFPHTAAWNASEAQEWFDPKQQHSAHNDGINSDEAPTVDAAIRAIAEEVYNNSSDTATTPPPPLVLYSNHLTLWDTYTDRYHAQFRQLFAFADDQCCGPARPYPYETVFHYRNFAQEMPRKAAALGFVEVSPVDLLHQVLLPNNATHVAVVGRFSTADDDAGVVADYLQVLRAAGLSVRVLEHQTATQDFCFLRATQQHLVGHARSTFFGWAALLSSTTSRITAYSIDSPSQRAWAERFGVDLHTHYDWRHSAELRARVEFPLLVEKTATTNTTTGDTTR